ncbi:hypothetical protein Goe21_02840 [Bacillus phage vB_BsuM-Goe21]|nr:hypothetical protein DA469_21305 [Bacillus subtilis]WCS68393.1 hypothetical protein Goe21_02840 [Bacillus phage vB_BsuM-Goe21]
MEKVQKPISISEKDKDFLFSLSEEDITLEMLEKLFANKKNTKAMFKPNDIFVLPKGRLYNDKSMTTTVGRYIFNLFMLSPKIIQLVGYQNISFDDGNIGGLENTLSEYLIEDKITVQEFADYIDKLQWLGFITAKFLNASLTYDLLEIPKETDALKKKLIQEHKKALESGDLIAINKIEKQLVADAKGRVSDIPDYQIYASGARGSFGNNYKNTTLLRGAIKNLANPDQVHISDASLMEGIPPEEIQYYSDIITQASYSRAVGTREGGYESKKLSAAFQNIVLDDEGSDCHTKKTVTVELNKGNANMFMYRYIVENNKLVLLTSDNINNYIGKIVNVRSPLYCLSKQYCSKCAGELYYRLGIRNVGIISNRIGTSLLNASLKAFHDMTLKVVNLDIDKYIE